MNITQAILHLVPDAQFSCWENDYARITWSDTNTRSLPTLIALQDAWPLVQAKDLQSQANAAAQAYLASTDWMVLRQADSGEPMPANIKELRAKAREGVVV